MGKDIASLDDDITEVQEAVAGLRRDLGAVASEVRDVAQAVGDVGSVLNQLGARFDEFAERYAQDQVRAQAEAELTRLTPEWQSRFARRRHTRALAQGLVHTLVRDALEHGVVEGAVIEACTGETMLADASHWLAPAVVALAADYLGEAQRARRARSIAYSLDPAKTDLFFALTCSRLGRFTEAARWRIGTCIPSIRSPSTRTFRSCWTPSRARSWGARRTRTPSTAMARWAWQFALAKGTDAGDQDPVARHVRDLRYRLDDTAFEELGTLCREAEWAHLRRGWELATVPSAVLEHLNEQFSDDPTPWSGTGPHTEGALGALIARFDTTSRRSTTGWSSCAVISHDGDVRAAQADLAAESEVRRPSDLRTLLANAVFVPPSVRLGEEARRLVLANLWPRVLDAAQECADRAVHLLPGELTIGTGEWRGVVPTDLAIPVDAETLAADLAGTIGERTDRRVAAVRQRPVRLWGAILLTAVAGLLGILTPSGPGPRGPGRHGGGLCPVGAVRMAQGPDPTGPATHGGTGIGASQRSVA
ncbi:hypothetical protein [Streptomyces sp. NPDC096323]|uniref:hypothetical protein n=1 Tax=Streptomyces sp. NPDC096323 TaxID=3155822 RepID=UPI003322B503